MKATKSILIGLAALSLAAYAQQSGSWPKIVTQKQLYAANDLRGKKAPALFVEQWLTGNAPETKGKVLFVDFWATWCGPCRELIPEVNAWAAKYGKDVVFVGISDEKAGTVKGFMEKTSMKYHVGIDTTSKMSKVLGVQGIPHVMIVSPDGIVRWQGWPGDRNDKLTDKILEQIIKASK